MWLILVALHHRPDFVGPTTDASGNSTRTILEKHRTSALFAFLHVRILMEP